MDAKRFTNEVLGLCRLDRYDSCGEHQSFFSSGSGHCDKWEDYFYASAATLTAYKDELNFNLKGLRDNLPIDSHIWMTNRQAMVQAYDTIDGIIND